MRTAKGADGGGSGVLAGAVGGGGVGTGVFFLHPAADIIKTAANTAKPDVLHDLRIIIPSLFWVLLVYPVRPHRLLIIPLRGQLLRMRAIREHGVNLYRPPVRRLINQMSAIRSPPWIFVLAVTRSKLAEYFPAG
jgi:hypothetical protein